MSSDELWRTPERRQLMIGKIAEAVRMFPDVLPRNPADVENSIYTRARTESEYLNMVGKIVLSIKQKGIAMQQQIPQWPHGMDGRQPGMDWMRPGIPPSQGGGGYPQPNHPPPPPQGMYPNPAIHQRMIHPPNQPMYGGPGGMMPPHNPAIYMGPSHPMQPGMHPHVRNPVFRSAPPMQSAPPIRVPGGMTTMTGPSGEQVVSAVPNPSFPGVPNIDQPVVHPPGPPSSYPSNTGQYSVPSPQVSSSTAPPSHPTPPHSIHQANSPKPYQVPSPSPNTPWNPNSPNVSTASPGQPAVTPEVNTAVMLKLQELQPYIPLLARMIDRLNRAGGNDKGRTDQLTKLTSLYNVIHNKNAKVPLQTLEKCHTALKKIFQDPPPPPIVPPSTTPPHPPIPPTPPIVPTHDFNIVRSPLPLSSNLYAVLDQREDPLDRLPYEKRIKLEERASKAPIYALKREIVHLKNYNIKKIQTAKELDLLDHTTTLECTLIDDTLLTMPPLIITIPHDYPSTSPSFKFSDSKEPFVVAVEELLKEKLSKCGYKYSLTFVLQMWEAAILKVVTKDLKEDKE